MNKQEKQLLLQDLCARLPYGVKVYAGEDLAMTLKQIDYKGFCESWENEDFKCHSRWMFPYLRPMSSMTEEEKEELKQISNEYLDEWENAKTSLEKWKLDAKVSYKRAVFYNSHHFDWNNLIPKGLAIAVTEGMYKTE